MGDHDLILERVNPHQHLENHHHHQHPEVRRAPLYYPYTSDAMVLHPQTRAKALETVAIHHS